VRGICHRITLVLAAEGTGAAMVVDGRGRLCVPGWLRRGPCASMVIGTDSATGVVVVAPTTVLDGLGAVRVGESW
jgi:hypothetical protein